MASAVSQQAGGCLVLKASEGSCGTAANPPAPGATFDVFCNRKIPEKVPIVASSGAAAEPSQAPALERLVSIDEVEALKAELAESKARFTELASRMTAKVSALESAFTERDWSGEIIALEAENRRLKAEARVRD